MMIMDEAAVMDVSTQVKLKDLKQRIAKLPGKENAKKRQAVNKSIRKLLEENDRSPSKGSGGGDGGDDIPDFNETTTVPKMKQHAGNGQPKSHVSGRSGKNKNKPKHDKGAGNRFDDGRWSNDLTPNASGPNRDFKFVSQCVRHERVGKGSFATCYRAIHTPTGKEVCLKTIDMCVKKIDNVDVRAELQYLDQMKHPNCLSLMGYEIDIDLMVTMVIEYCPYSLESIRVANDKTESVRTRIDYTLARKCIMQVVRGVRYLHNFSEKQSIAHFDIKPDNVVVTLDGVCKIADFGLAVTLNGKKDLVTDGLYRGTDEYMAPEVSASGDSPYGIAADIWSIGVTFYELIFGRLCKPTRDSYARRLMEALKVSGLMDEQVDVEVVSFFAGCFKSDPAKRYTIEDLAKHPLLRFSVANAQRALVDEIKVVEGLKKLRTRAQKTYEDGGALPDLELQSSSSESSSSEEDDDDDDDEEDDEEDKEEDGDEDGEDDEAEGSAEESAEEGEEEDDGDEEAESGDEEAESSNEEETGDEEAESGDEDAEVDEEGGDGGDEMDME